MRWFFIGLIVLLLIAFFFIRSDFFNIKKVDIQMDKVACTDVDQIKDSSNLLRQNIILLNSSKVKEVIKNKFLCVKDVQISRRFPDRVGIKVLGREPKALVLTLKNVEATKSASFESIATPSGTEKDITSEFVVDNEIIFGSGSNSFDITKIYYKVQNLSIGQKLDDAMLNTLKILEKVKSYGTDVKEVMIFDGFLIIFPLQNNPKVVFKFDKNIDTQLASLQLILNQAKIDENQLEFIDLRFDKPVIKLAPKKT